MSSGTPPNELVETLRASVHVFCSAAPPPCWSCRAVIEAADEIERLEAELQRIRAAWVAGDDPDCSDVCLEQCQCPEVCS